MSRSASDETQRVPQRGDDVTSTAPVGAAEQKDDGGDLAAVLDNDGPVLGAPNETVVGDVVAIEERPDALNIVIAHGAPPFRRSTAARLRSLRPSRRGASDAGASGA